MGKRTTSRVHVWTAGLGCALGLAAAGVARADESSPAETHVQASLICEQAALVPGSTATLALAFDVQPRWHMYWNGRNDSGGPPEAKFDLPTGFTVDALQWPTPVRQIEPGGILNHVYFDNLTLLAPLHVPSSAQPGTTVTLKAKVSWMVCESSCVLEEANVQIKIPIAKSGDAAGRSPAAKRIDQARARMPRDLPKNSLDVRIAWTRQTVAINAVGASHLTFYPDDDCVPFAEAIKDADTDRSVMTIRLGDPETGHTNLAGTLEIRRGKGEPDFYHIRAPQVVGPDVLPKPTDVPEPARVPRPTDPSPMIPSSPKPYP